jgi:hypothetical protein
MERDIERREKESDGNQFVGGFESSIGTFQSNFNSRLLDSRTGHTNGSLNSLPLRYKTTDQSLDKVSELKSKIQSIKMSINDDLENNGIRPEELSRLDAVSSFH